MGPTWVEMTRVRNFLILFVAVLIIPIGSVSTKCYLDALNFISLLVSIQIKLFKDNDQIRTMAAVDRFEFLLREILDYFSHIRDSFAILGAFYAARKTLKTSWSLLNALNVHFLSRLSQKCDLTEKFGEWAGRFFNIQRVCVLTKVLEITKIWVEEIMRK